jgi:hypothetical protein
VLQEHLTAVTLKQLNIAASRNWTTYRIGRLSYRDYCLFGLCSSLIGVVIFNRNTIFSEYQVCSCASLRTTPSRLRGNVWCILNVVGPAAGATPRHLLHVFLYTVLHALGPLAVPNQNHLSKWWNPFRRFGRTPWAVDLPITTRHVQRRDSTTQHRESRTYIHASCGIRTPYPILRVVQNHTRLTPRGHWDRPDTPYARAVLKVRGLAAVRRCYAEGGGDSYAKL